MRKIRILCALLCLVLLTGCCSWNDARPAAPKTQTEAQAAPASEHTAEAASAPESGLVEGKPARPDASGSADFEKLTARVSAHPAAVLHETVELPGYGAVDSDTESLDLTELSGEQILALAPELKRLPELKTLALPAGEEGVDLDTALSIAASLPDTVITYPFTIYGQEADLSDTELVFFHQRIYDQGEEVRKVLPAMHACTWLDMDSCHVDNEHMAVIRDENPNVEVIWRVWFGESYSVRTNVTKILASMPSQGGLLKDDNCDGLYYCTKVRYLDLGHNHTLKDFGFVENMPDLEIAVISMAAIEDLTPFASCENLLYLEMGNTKVCDLSPLAECKNLKHLNIGTNIGITDISPLYDLDLLRLWIGTYTPIPEEQVEMMQQLHPDCDINTTVPSGLEKDEKGGAANEGYTIEWKSYSLPIDMGGYWIGSRPIGYYKVVYKCFGYSKGDRSYAFAWNDPKYTGYDPYAEPINVTVWDTSFLLEYWRNPHSDEPDDTDGPPGEILYQFEH